MTDQVTCHVWAGDRAGVYFKQPALWRN